MPVTPKPRFYALIFGQAIGLLIIVLGMTPYWAGAGEAKVPKTITARVVSVCVLIFLSVLIPLFINFAGNIVKGLSNNEVDNQERIADNLNAVRTLLWVYMYGDFLLLTYLVHITGGIAGSMFAGIYLMLPAIPLLLRLDKADVGNIQMLVVACSLGIFLSFLMSHYHYFEFNAESFEHAFDLSITLVTIFAMVLPLVEIAVLRRHVEKGSTTGGQEGI